MPIPATKEEFGTKLHGSVDHLNREPEHRRIGLVWMYDGESIWITDGPREGANLAGGYQICEEIARHIKAGGIQIQWPYRSGDVAYDISIEGVKEIDCWT